MSNLTYFEARREILVLFKAAWDPTGHAAIFQDTKDDKPVGVAPYAKVFINHFDGGQGSLTGSDGTSVFDRVGTLLVQIFTPPGDGLSLAYALGKILSDAYEGKATPGGVWFRNAQIKEIGADGAYQQLNFLVDFEYTEIK
jgi:hypothetical protein